MKKQKLIDGYFSGTLSSEEKNQLSQLLKNDSVFNEEFLFCKNLKQVAEYEDNEVFKTQIQQFEGKVKLKYKSYTLWLVAASIIVLFGIGYFVVFQNTVNNETLYAENFEPYRNVIQPIIRSTVSVDLKTQAFTAYEKKEFKKAIQLFSKIQKTDSEAYYIFYKANSFLALDDTNEAIILLKKYSSTQGDFTEKAQWYLALAYLKENNIISSKNILQSIVTSKSYNFEKAAVILKKLK